MSEIHRDCSDALRICVIYRFSIKNFYAEVVGSELELTKEIHVILKFGSGCLNAAAARETEF